MSNANKSISVGSIMASGISVLRRQWPTLLGVGALCALVQLAQHAENHSKAGGIAGVLLAVLLAPILTIAVQAVGARRVLENEGLANSASAANYGAFIGTAILAGLGITLGLILFIVPGIMLMMRWFLATNYNLAKGLGVSAAMAASGNATKGHRGILFVGWILFALVAGTPYGLLVASAGGFKVMATLATFSVQYIALTLWAVCTTAVGIAFSIGCYALLSGPDNDHLADVFA